MANFGASGGSFGGSAIGQAYLRLTLDTAGYQAKLGSAKSQTVSSVSSMGKEFSKLGSTIKSVLTTLGAVELIRRSIAAYDEQTKAVARLNIAVSNSPALIGANTDALIAQASALSRLTGMQDENIIGAQAALSVFGLTEDQLRRLTPLVLDFAAFTGQDATSAAQSLGRAVLGNARALKTIGIDFERSGDAAKDFEQIITLVGSKVGGTAAAVATPMDRLRVATDEAMESIGGALAPAMEELAGILGSIEPEVLATAAAFGTLWATIGRGPAIAITAGTALGKFLNDINPARGLLEDFGEAINDAWSKATTGSKDVELVPDDAIRDLTEMADEVDNGTMSMSEFQAVVDEFNETYGAGFEAAGLVGRDLDKIADAAENADSALSTFAGKTAEELIDWQESAAESFNFVEEALGRVAGRAEATGAGLLKAMRLAMERQRDFKQNTEEAFGAVREEFGASGDAFIEYVAGMGTGGAHLVEILSNMASNNRAKFRSVVRDFLVAMGVAGDTADAIANIGDQVNNLPPGKLITITANTANAYSAIISLVNAVAAIPSYKTVHISTIHGGQVALAEGGIVKGAAGFITRGPTMLRSNVMVGEAGYSTAFGKGAEAVIPLTDATLDRLADAITRRGGAGGVLKIYGPGDPNLIAEAVERRMARRR